MEKPIFMAGSLNKDKLSHFINIAIDNSDKSLVAQTGFGQNNPGDGITPLKIQNAEFIDTDGVRNNQPVRSKNSNILYMLDNTMNMLNKGNYTHTKLNDLNVADPIFINKDLYSDLDTSSYRVTNNTIYKDKDGSYKMHRDKVSIELDEKADKYVLKPEKNQSYDVEAEFYQLKEEGGRFFKKIDSKDVKEIKKVIPSYTNGVHKEGILLRDKTYLKKVLTPIVVAEMQDGTHTALVMAPKSNINEKKNIPGFHFPNPETYGDVNYNASKIINRINPHIKDADHVKSYKEILNYNTEEHNKGTGIFFDKDGKGNIIRVADLKELRLDTPSSYKKIESKQTVKQSEIKTDYMNKHRTDPIEFDTTFQDKIVIDVSHADEQLVYQVSKEAPNKVNRVAFDSSLQSIVDSPLMSFTKIDTNGMPYISPIQTIKQFMKDNKGQLPKHLIKQFAMFQVLDSKTLLSLFC